MRRRSKYDRLILAALQANPNGLTAREFAEMHNVEQVSSTPRFSVLVDLGRIHVAGKKLSPHNIMVMLYKLGPTPNG